MKKSILLLLFLISSCRSFNSAEQMKFDKITSNKLPNLEIIFNNDDLIFNSTAISLIAGEQAYALNSAHKGDLENFLKTHIEQQIRNDIIDEYSSPRGYISFRIAANNSSNAGLLMFPSILSLGTLNLLGMPAGWSKTKVELEARIYDKSRRLIKVYTGTGSDKNVIACYYGYSEMDSEKVSMVNSVKIAMSSIKEQINSDYPYLISKLK